MKQMRIKKESHKKLKAFADENGWTLDFAIKKLLEKADETS